MHPGAGVEGQAGRDLITPCFSISLAVHVAWWWRSGCSEGWTLVCPSSASSVVVHALGLSVLSPKQGRSQKMKTDEMIPALLGGGGFRECVPSDFCLILGPKCAFRRHRKTKFDVLIRKITVINVDTVCLYLAKALGSLFWHEQWWPEPHRPHSALSTVLWNISFVHLPSNDYWMPVSLFCEGYRIPSLQDQQDVQLLKCPWMLASAMLFNRSCIKPTFSTIQYVGHYVMLGQGQY